MENAALIGNTLVLLGIFIIFAGFLILVFGAFFEKNSSFESEAAWKKPFENNSEIRGGGVIMLGPIPLIFGSDGESAKSAIILALLLTGLAFFFFR